MSSNYKRLFIALAFVISSLYGMAKGTTSSLETQRIYLSGKGSTDAVDWEFFCTDGRKSGEWTTIKVPSCWEQEGFGTYNYGVNFYGKPTDPLIPTEQGKYRYKFDVPADWSGQRIRIVFEGVMTDAEVRINGKKAGDTHQGGFYRFKYDITNYLLFGKENQLDVVVSKESANESVNLSERRADYWNFGGIFRPVFLEVNPPRFIERMATVSEADGTYKAEVFLGEGVVGDYEVKAEVFDIDGKKIGKSVTEKVIGGSDKIVLKTKFDGVKLWTAETPNLYQTKITLSENGEAIHEMNARIGFRTFEIRKRDGVYLNGQRIMMRGVNRHSFWPETGRTLNKELNYEDVRLMKEMNMNTVRMSHYPPDPEFLDACDELGLYVMDEIGGWHGHYDTGVGRKLVMETVTRDVNHTSILFWDNGNEGGWNTDLDGEFAKWDPQNRPVIHPQQDINGMETMHYRSYGETEEYLRGKDLFFPTEFLHGLYDGGHGAGLYDYWQMMYYHPNCTGGLLWVYADEGVVRTDKGGMIDNDGNHGADGIVGPHHEKEGSFFTIKQVWSPVQLWPEKLPTDFNGTLTVENRYDFINLKECSFTYKLVSFSQPTSKEVKETVVSEAKIASPTIAPHAKGDLKLNLPAGWESANALYVTAIDPFGEELFTWSYPLSDLKYSHQDAKKGDLSATEDSAKLMVTAGKLKLSFDKTTGLLADVKQNGKQIDFANGPQFIAARRGDRSLDKWMGENLPEKVDRIYPEIPGNMELETINWKREADAIVVTTTYFGALKNTTWRIFADESVKMEYSYQYDGIVELMGVKFDYPEEQMKSIQYLGFGPYRVWQNRVRGTKLGVWQNNYNDPIPGESFIYPEFKGYFRDWQWAVFTTSQGEIHISNEGKTPFLGVYTPRDGRDALLYTLPQSGLSLLDVIPAIRNKVNNTDLCGPSSQAPHVSGLQKGAAWFRFVTK